MPDPLRAAYEAGRQAHLRGRLAYDNPHDEWYLGVAWATGWHSPEGLTEELREQAGLAGLFIWSPIFQDYRAPTKAEWWV